MKMKGKYLTGAVVFLLLGGMVVSCKKKPADPFPASNTVAGWQKTAEARTFKAEDLWQYIDGDSDRYLKAGVVTASTADYKYQGTLDATVDVYTMSSAAGAKDIFGTESAADAKTVPVGDEGKLYTQSLVFRKGKYLVRIVGFAPAPELEGALLALGQGVAARL
jgi:hypothetical protein